jgi:hypothetical protein
MNNSRTYLGRYFQLRLLNGEWSDEEMSELIDLQAAIVEAGGTV